MTDLDELTKILENIIDKPRKEKIDEEIKILDNKRKELNTKHKKLENELNKLKRK